MVHQKQLLFIRYVLITYHGSYHQIYSRVNILLMVTLVWAFSFGMILPPLIEVIVLSQHFCHNYHISFLSGLGHPGPGQRHIFMHNPEERRKVSEEVPLHLRLPPALHRHHPLLLRHLLQGAAEQVSNF